MYKTKPRMMAALLLAGTLLFSSCQKEQLSKDDSQTLAAFATSAKTSNDRPPAPGDDAAFDAELDAVLHSGFARMDAMMAEMSCEPDVAFAHMMIMHHQTGVDAANVALKYEHHKEGIKLTEKSRDANLKSIERLQRCLEKHDKVITLSPEQCAAFKEEIMREMMLMRQDMERALHENDRNDVDLDFSEVIIQHHEGAIAMSAIELEYGHDQCMRSEADRLIDEQAKEIEAFSEFKNEHIYGMLKH